MKITMTPSSRGLNVNCEMVEAFEAVLPQSILAKLESFSFAICCKDGGYAICLQSFKALSDDVYHGPLTKYIDKNNWFGFVDDVKSKPEYKARLAELHVPAAIAPEIELLELHEQWNDHNKDLNDRCEYLNNLHIRELRYKSSNGTDFTVGMIPEAQFCGGGEYTIGGSYFNPNLPTEECFISPKRGEAEGIVYSSKPLSYQGQLIEDFSIRFEHGRAVEAHARTNEALLQKLIAMDEGSAYLGECALVPYDSPINQTGILFYNTLFDENACCHLALGMGFIDTIRDYPNRTLEEMRALGVNDSMIHEDFMIGTPDLAITAHCRDGRTVPVFRDGTWAF